MKRLDIKAGQRFNKLVILEELPLGERGRLLKCKCDCGTIKNIYLSVLVRSLTKSCGCHRLAMRTKHGMHESREYSTWENMIQRCTNPNARKYFLYGGRGVTICDEWITSFKSFYRDMGNRPDNTSLDRIDSEKGYYKENCKWSNPREQLVNVRFFHQKIRYNGIVESIEHWINELQINREIFKARVLRGFGFKEALFCEITCDINIMTLNVSNGRKVLYNLSNFLDITNFDKNKIFELLDGNHTEPFNNYILRYKIDFKEWPIKYI